MCLAVPRHTARRAVALVLGAWFIATLACSPATAAQGTIALAASAAFEGNYAPERWLPISIVLRNDGPASRVVVAAMLPGAATRNTLALELAGGAETQATLYAAMDSQTRELLVSVERDGATLAEQRLEVRPRPGERLLGLVAAQPFTLNLPRRQDLVTLPFLPFALTPAALPDQPAGLSSLSLLVLRELPAETLRPAQLDTLLAWVRSGGHLVIGGGPGAEATLASLPAELRLATIGGSTPLDAASLGEYAAAPAPAQLEGVVLSAALDPAAFGPSEAPLWLQRELGAGRVTQLAFDPGLPTLGEWPGAPALWDRLLRSTRFGAGLGETSNEGLRSQVLSIALANLPAINLPNAGLLFALLAIYAILIGPGVALLLRRLDRQDLGWIVLPGAALVVLAAGVGLALTSRADQRIVSQITLVEQVGPETALSRSALGILSPQDQNFAVGIDASALTRPLVAGSALFGPIEPASGDLDQNGGALQLEVERWTLQGVLAEALVPLPALDAQIVLSANGIEATVRNTTGQALRDVTVAYGGRVVNLGNLEPAQSATAPWPPPPPPDAPLSSNGPLSVLVLGDALAARNEPGSLVERRVLIQEALINAAVGRGSAGEASEPLVLAWLAQSPLPLAVEAPGAARQQESLLVARPRIVGNGPVFVPAGWAQLELGDPPRDSCTGTQGRGLLAAPAPLTITLALPPDLAALRAADATISLESEREWPNAGVRTELYDWNAERWLEIDFDGPGSLVLGQAEPFVRGGRLRLRLSGRIEEAGCVFAGLTLRGDLPLP